MVLFTVFTALTLLTPDRGWIMLAILRVIVGAGVGGLNITSIPYVQEFVPARRRGLLAGLASVFIPIGLLLGAQAQLWFGETIGWRGLIALGALPILLLWLRTVPESPRFLQSRGRDDEARSTGLGLGYGIGATAKIIGPFLMGALIGGDAIKQNVTRDAVPPAFFLFAVLLVVGGIIYLLAKETRNVALEKI